MTSHDEGPRTSKPSSSSEKPDSRILRAIMGPKDLATPAHFISSPRPTPRRKKCLRTNREVPNCQKTLSANRGHGRISDTPLKTASLGVPSKKD